ncbi:MAG: hypothetical protein JXA74_00500 [Anaerolineae bacterium]|nr:hypothetical protein [Anaerolineae bacterium]
MRFPNLQGENLNREPMNLPDDFAGEVNLVFIAFQQIQQIAVNSWLPFVQKLVARTERPRLAYYELPTISRAWGVARGFVDGGMRSGIRDIATRGRTITLYLDKQAFRAVLELPSEDTIHLLLVDAQGQVFWRTEGEYAPDKAAALEAALTRWSAG